MKAERENRGVIFKNNKKEKDTHADYKGVLNIHGEEFWLNVWINTAKSGEKYMAVMATPKEAREERGKPALKVVGGSDPDDGIPF
jgi:hypothetical protein